MSVGRRAASRLAAATLGLVVVTGCQPAAPPPAPDPARPSPASSAAGFRNPVFAENFPDPMILPRSGGGYLAVGTNGRGSNVQTLLSQDLVQWESGPDALPQVARWSSPGKVWAPEVAVHGRDRYVLYYTTRAPDPEIQCVGVAVARRAEGPYADSSSRPLVCQPKQGGSIDAHPFTTSQGRRYLYWKNDGNAVGVDTYLSVQALDATGTRLIGKPRRLFKQDLPWEGSLVEAPFLWEHQGVFHLFYSANDFGSDAYAVGHARASNPLGPFVKDPEPVLTSNEVAAGPGHCALFAKDGAVWMAYHAWEPGAVGSEIPGRTLWLSEVSFSADSSVRVLPPTTDYPERP